MEFSLARSSDFTWVYIGLGMVIFLYSVILRICYAYLRGDMAKGGLSIVEMVAKNIPGMRVFPAG